MSPRKQPVKNPTKPATNKTVEHYNAILLEDIRSRMETVIEGMQSTEEKLTHRMDDMETRLSAAIRACVVQASACQNVNSR